MDAQTRHALKQNEFGEMLGSLRDSVGTPSFRKWVLVVAVLVVAIIAWQFWRASARRSSQSAWAELNNTLYAKDSAEAIQSLRRQAQENSGGPVGAAARLMLAHLLMEEGLSDPAKAQASTSEAADFLRQIVDSPNLSDTYKAAARFKLASANETLGKFDEARKQYDVLMQDQRFAGSPFRMQAEERLKDLDQIAKVPAFTPGNAPVASQPAAMPPVDTTIQMPLDSSLPVETTPPPTTQETAVPTPQSPGSGSSSETPDAAPAPTTQPATP